ncbi:hypothetical protein AU255_13730 [Methyloprofundus sedimenti]|uniref:HTH tetR-type domain-containing protein n=1 Tax=Methyloprofundus sedimenti TaxID=1420851 RepID=A0A1V8M3M0_9GAMM|nr:TetR/AcrR family transcriptional regulator [Methyloprofundus sedimenti]OQK16160.1 hypothetical protein AU255_13730 [Methyloprofundus sedimenti]
MNTERKPENARVKIINAAFQEMHKHGYQGMRVDQVLKEAGLKKGAMYHYFPSKKELAYAVLEEYIMKKGAKLWIEPLAHFSDPLKGLHTLFIEGENAWDDKLFTLGCPLNNLAQEMSPIDEGFRERIVKIFQFWKEAISEALKKGQKAGIVDKSINTDDSALFILMSIEGAWGLTKSHQNKEVYYSCGRELERYLNTLKVKL